ncbi:MAG: monovalent cation/H(+) antiporter subunit G [Candidatus Binatia bacterium]
MEIVYEVLTFAFLAGGSFFALTAAVGLLKMPDFYTRAHPAGKSDTLAQTLIMAGLLVHTFHSELFGFQAGIKLALIVFILFITAPTATHAITKAAHVSGLKLWRKDDQGDV